MCDFGTRGLRADYYSIENPSASGTVKMNDKNSTRAGRSIENTDDRKNPVPVDPGENSPHGRRMPHYRDDILEDEENAALDHVQVSGIGDIAEDSVVPDPVRPTKRTSK
jgi:hypothetical protein